MKASEALKSLVDKINVLIEKEKEVGERCNNPYVLNETVAKRFAYAEVKILIADLIMQQPLGD